MNFVKVKRIEKGLTQEQLAKLVDIDRTMIGKIESGAATPSVNLAKKIADILGFEWTRFFDEKSA